MKTRFVDRIFYFGYDVKAWTLEQMVFEMGSQVFSGVEMQSFQAMGMAAQVGKLVKVLRSGRYGLMLDNLESVTGQALAIQNTLTEEERAKVRSFLEQVVGGKSWVVLGSRGQEEWLSSVYGAGRYELRGLDQEARSILAKKVLERHVGDVAKRRSILADEGFGRLMKVLAGYPLAIEVVLANLGRQSVAEVLAGLDLGDVNLDRDGGRTESILQCVEYSHGNLSAAAQKLLLCLAPFSGFIDRSVLGEYAAELQKLEAFRSYPFEQFDGAVQEAIDWGLLAPMVEDMPELLLIQPVFPYFLKTKLAAEDEVMREALRDGFKNHYLGLASSYVGWMNSKDAKEKQLGIFFCRLEYENLYGALQICLERQKSISIFVCLDKYFQLMGDPSRALNLAEGVYKGVERYPDQWKEDKDNNEYQVMLNLLACCYLQTKRYSEARLVYQKELTIKEVKGDRCAQAVTYHQLGNVSAKLQEYKEAHENYQKALKIFDEFNDRYSQASTYHLLGNIFAKLQEYEEARENYQQALKIFNEFNDRYSQASIYHQLGNVSAELREYKEARVNYQQALQIKVEFNNRYEQADTYHNLGAVSAELREYEEARVNYQQALQIKIEFNACYEQAKTYGQLGLLAEVKGNSSEAISCLQKALEIFTEFGDENSMRIARYNLARIENGE